MTAQKKKRFNESELEPVARDATRKALEQALAEGYSWISPEQDEKLTLGTFIEDDRCIFALYIAGERPRDGLIVSKVAVERYTGELSGEVDVYLPPIPATELSDWWVGRR